MDKKWVKNIYTEYQNLVYRIAVSIIKDAQLAEDIMQDVFVTLHYNADHIRDKSKIKTWLIRATVNRSIDFTRKFHRVVALPSDFFEQQSSSALSDPAGEMDKKELVLEIREGISSLPADLKVLVVLYYYLEMPQKDISEVMETPLNTVKTRLRRARLMIRSYLLNMEKTVPGKLSPQKGVSQFD